MSHPVPLNPAPREIRPVDSDQCFAGRTLLITGAYRATDGGWTTCLDNPMEIAR